MKFRLNAKVLGGGKCSMLAEGDIDLAKLVPAKGMTVRKQSPTKADFVFYVDGVPVDLSISKLGDPEEEACQCRDRPLKALKRAALAASLAGEDASKMLEFIDLWSDTDRWVGDLKVALEIGYNPQDIIANLGLPQDADPEHLLVDLEGRLKEHTRNFMQNLLEPDAACTEEH